MSDEDWRAFLADTVTPRFPHGLPVFDTAGQWRDSQGSVVRERSKMVLILAEPDSDALTRLDEIAEKYKQRFSQDSVLRVVDSACVAFYVSGALQIKQAGSALPIFRLRVLASWRRRAMPAFAAVFPC